MGDREVVVEAGESGQGHRQKPVTLSPSRTAAMENGKGGVESKVDIEEDEKSICRLMKGGGRGKEISSVHGDYHHEELNEKPTQLEVMGWHIYELCSYFIQTVLIPMVFPLILSQLVELPTDPVEEWVNSHNGTLSCATKAVRLYAKLTHRTIGTGNSKFSPLEWTTFSWVIGLVLAAPILALISYHLDHGQDQSLITMISTGVGAVFCLPAGFFKTVKIFPPYIAAIVAAITVASASHTRNFGLMLHGYVGLTIRKSRFPSRQRVSSWLSLCSTTVGCLGSAVMASFTYHMLHEKNERDFVNLWVISIFSGLIWMVGITHAITCIRSSFFLLTPLVSQPFTIFRHPHALGALTSVFLSSLTTMVIFTGGQLFLVGQQCLKPVFLLYFWIAYFIFPVISLPLMQPLKQLIKANAAKMQVLGFLFSTLTTGFGFYFNDNYWNRGHVLVFAAIQGTSAGLLHAYGRVLFVDCIPPGKEGSFSIWYSWIRSLGLCAGFTIGSVSENIRASFGTAFCTGLFGIMVLIFGNISDLGGAVSAGYVTEDNGLKTHTTHNSLEDNISIMKEPVHLGTS